jgi:hypothetical protein
MDTKITKNCNSKGNSPRGYTLEPRGEFNPKEKHRDSSLLKCVMPFVPFVFFVVASSLA